MFDFSNNSTKSKYCDNSNKLVVGKIKYGRAGVAIKECVRLKPFSVENNIENEKVKGAYENAVAAISYNGYKDLC